MSWKPSFGAWREGDEIRFRVWAPVADQIDVVIRRRDGAVVDFIFLEDAWDGTFRGSTSKYGEGLLYRLSVNRSGDEYPDPASRFQPDGVHNWSEVIDPSTFPWTDDDWNGLDRDEAIIYELHVGTFSPEGTFDGVTKRLGDLADLGVTALKLMPVNDFPGRWNWGYDGVSLFAPARCYGRPDDLRRLVDTAHAYGIAVLLDVVYNHFGPDGNYTGWFSPYYVRADRQTNWGPAINLGGEHSAMVREFFFENARMWLHEYHLDGFRLDATHALVDDGPRPFLEEFSEVVRAFVPDRKLILTAEDHRNLDKIIRPKGQGGWNFDGVWSDDFHHVLRRHLTGDSDGVFQDFLGTLPELARTINQGWLSTGQYSAYRETNRGTDPTGIPPHRFIYCIQNHDRVGNRAGGRRLNHDVDLATYRAATAALLFSPQTPLLFMGQEWAASSPFFYFTDHNEELGKLVREGRSREFRKYADFTDPARLATIPDPQAETTFLSSRLDHDEANREPHASTLRLYRDLLRLRRDEPAFRLGSHRAFARDDWLFIMLGVETDDRIIAVIRFHGPGELFVSQMPIELDLILTTEDPPYAPDPMPIQVVATPAGRTIQFGRPGAALIRLP